MRLISQDGELQDAIRRELSGERLTQCIKDTRNVVDAEQAEVEQLDDVALRFEAVTATLSDLEVEALRVEATEQERRVLLDELCRTSRCFPAICRSRCTERRRSTSPSKKPDSGSPVRTGRVGGSRGPDSRRVVLRGELEAGIR
jgi:hypothetical protein